MIPTYVELIDALEDMCNQHCIHEENGELNSGGLSADADALRLLARFGTFRITKERGRVVIGTWRDKI